jgi:hypothetical protein
MMMGSLNIIFEQIYSMLPQPVHGSSIVFFYGPQLDHIDGFLLVYALTFVCFFLNSDNRFPARVTDVQSIADSIPEFNTNFTQTESLGFIMATYEDG